MQESRIEKRLKKEIEKIGGKALKFISPGMSGIPDRLVLFKGIAIFVELKAPGEKLRALQEYRAKELKALGFRVEMIDTVEKVGRFVLDLKSERR